MTFSNNNPFAVSHHSHALDIDAKLNSQCFEDLDGLDNALISPAMERRDSFGTSTYTPFSPQSSTNPWIDETFSIPPSSTSGIHPERHMSISNHLDPVIGSNNPFLQHHNFQWTNPMYGPNDSKTPIMMPVATYDFTPDYDPSMTVPFSSAPTFNAVLPMAENERPAAVMPSSTSTASVSSSPQPPPAKEWMTLAEQDMDSNRLPNKRIRQHPPQRPLTPGFSKRDGVRKKNARFDIPEGRSLSNIDQLIIQATAQGQEDDIKELKQQKRLLRNRQAALDSRQRKKKHTEELEKEQKVWHDHRGEFQLKMEQMAEALDNTKLHNDQLQRQVAELAAELHRLNHEKQSQLEDHTQETMLLRTQIMHLKDELQRSPLNQPQHSGMFIDFTSDAEELQGGEWDDLILDDVVDDELDLSRVSYDVETPIAPATALVIGKPRTKDIADAPLASGGFLLMLLLYGAFVASKSTGSSAPPMPGMSDEMRQASANVVDGLLKGGQHAQPALTIVQAPSRVDKQAAPSTPAWVQPQAAQKKKVTTQEQHKKPSRNLVSKLDGMAATMLTPSKQAQVEAAFSLTPAQYNSLTSTEIPPHNTWEDDEILKASNERRKYLADSLRQRREQAGESEVYRRSLLWDTIPENVLQDFRRMVEENNKHDQEGSKGATT